MAWGSGGLRSCTSLWERIEKNQIEELYLLPTKVVSEQDWTRCIAAIAQHGADRRLTSLNTSGHFISLAAMSQLARTIAMTSQQKGWKLLAIGNYQMGNEGVSAILNEFRQQEYLHLESFDMSLKGLTSNGLVDLIIWAFTTQNNMKSLNLSRNVFDKWEETMVTTQKGPYRTASLHELNLSECGIKSVDDGNNHLLGFLATTIGQSSLHKLNLSNNSLGSFGSNLHKIIPDGIKELDLSKCDLNDDILDQLLEFESLEVLDVSHNQFSEQGAMTIAKGLAEKWPRLKSLNLANNEGIGEGGIRSIAHGGMRSRCFPVLDILDLGQTMCGVEGAKSVITQSQAKSIRLFGNNLGSEGLKRLADCLNESLEGLETLDVGGNGADESAVITFLEGLLNTQCAVSLQMVIVGGNQGGPNLESLIREIKVARPKLDIGRDKIKPKEG